MIQGPRARVSVHSAAGSARPRDVNMRSHTANGLATLLWDAEDLRRLVRLASHARKRLPGLVVPEIDVATRGGYGDLLGCPVHHQRNLAHLRQAILESFHTETKAAKHETRSSLAATVR